MRFPLFLRFLLAITLFALLTTGGELLLSRWRLFGVSDAPAGEVQGDVMTALPARLTEYFLSQGGWSFQALEPAARRDWFLVHWPELTSGAPVLAAYGLRLEDEGGHYLAGQKLSRFLIAFASIDTRRLPVVVRNRTVGYLVFPVARSAAEALTLAFLIDQQANLFLVTLLSLGFSGVLAVLLALQLRRPLRALSRAVVKIREGDYQQRVAWSGKDELGDLARSFDALAERLAQAEQARRQWVADTSHELRTPLSVLHGQIEALQEGIRRPNAENFAVLQRHVEGLNRLVDELYQLAQADLGSLHYRWQDCDPWRVLERCAADFSERFRACGLSLQIATFPDSRTVMADPERLQQVFVNLLENSCRYTAAGGVIEIRGRYQNPWLEIDIADTAPGVPDEALARLGERFYRVETSRSRELGGSGLGLPLAKIMVAAHGGSLTFSHAQQGGLLVKIRLPVKENS